MPPIFFFFSTNFVIIYQILSGLKKCSISIHYFYKKYFAFEYFLHVSKESDILRSHFSDKKNHNEGSRVLPQSVTVKVSRGTVADCNFEAIFTSFLQHFFVPETFCTVMYNYDVS